MLTTTATDASTTFTASKRPPMPTSSTHASRPAALEDQEGRDRVVFEERQRQGLGPGGSARPGHAARPPPRPLTPAAPLAPGSTARPRHAARPGSTAHPPHAR